MSKIEAKLIISPLENKKYRALWFQNGKKIKHTDFGQKGAEDFTIHKNTNRKQLYINRHRKNENWTNPYSAGSLSRYVLWEKPDLKSSWSFYKKKFGFL